MHKVRYNIMANYSRNKQVFEIFEEYKKADGRDERVAVLQANKDVVAFRDILRGTFDDSLVFNLPEGRPPFNANKPESVPSSLLKEFRKFYLFVKGTDGERLPQYRREQLFIQLLESIHPEDAEYVLKMVAKRPPCRYVTKKIVQEALPDLIRE